MAHSVAADGLCSPFLSKKMTSSHSDAELGEPPKLVVAALPVLEFEKPNCEA